MWLRTGSYFYCTHLEYSTTAGLDRRSHHLHTAVGGKLLAPVTTTTYTDKIYPKEHEQLLDDKMLLAPDLINLLHVPIWLRFRGYPFIESSTLLLLCGVIDTTE